jgi:hypothetical protein
VKSILLSPPKCGRKHVLLFQASVCRARSDDELVVLLVQMAAIHLATMRTATLLGASKTRETVETYERSLNRLARTYVAQVEGLKRYRSKGEQRFYVERVTVNEGGQAIVGPVRHGGKQGDEENGH